MILGHRFAALGLVVTFLLVPFATAKVAALKNNLGVHGTVVAVNKEKGTITLKIHYHHKKNAATPPLPDTEKTFRVTNSTKFEILMAQGKGKGKQFFKTEPTSFQAVRIGEKARISASPDDTANEVVIVVHAHNKNSTSNPFKKASLSPQINLVAASG